LQNAVTSKAKAPEPASVSIGSKDFWPDHLRERGPICLILAAAIALVFWPVGAFEFVNYDDPDYVSANPHVQAGVTWENVVWAFTTGHASNWHPLTWLSHMMDWQFFGQNPGAQHLVSAGFHALNVVLLFLVLRRMTDAHWRSALVAALFGLHPLRAESVAWISERKDVLSGFFLLLTMAAYCRYVESSERARNPGLSLPDPPQNSSAPKATTKKGPKFPRGKPQPSDPGKPSPTRVWYSISLVCFALGLMSKPMLVTLPFCLLLLDYWPLERFRLERQDAQKLMVLMVEKVPFFLLAIGSSLVTFLVQRSGGAVSTSLALPARLANALVSYTRYLGKTLWPEKLSVLYPHPGHWPAWQVMGSGIILAIIVVLAILWARQRPYVPVGWFWFLGTLVPVIGLVQVGVQSMADRYSYVPSIGLFVLLVWGVAEFAEYRPAAQPALGVAAVASVLACACITANQIRFWHDSEALFQRAIEVTPNNYLAYNNLGFDLSAKGRFREAKENYAKSIAINPQYPDALNNMGFALAGEKNYVQAIPYYEAALRVSPRQPEVHNNLGNALSELGRLDESIEQYLIVLREQPEHADAHNNLGIALAMQGKLPEAETHFREAIRLKPKYASAHGNLGNALAALHQIPAAIHEYQECLRLNPNDAQAHNNLGNALVEQARLSEAIEQYTVALRLNANNPEAEFNLAIALLRQDKKAEAAPHFQAALQLNPSNTEARRQLELLKGQ
jgi:tetratricopeptide (TPR) repeat protein